MQNTSTDSHPVPQTQKSMKAGAVFHCPLFFKTPADFRKWLKKHHQTEVELWVGFYKTHTGRPSITWPQSVDAALCYGWIDGLRKSIDEHSYSIRFTPRKSTSNWSTINIKRMQELLQQGLVSPAGKKAFEARKAEKSGIYSYEQRHRIEFDAGYKSRFESHPKAWTFFQSQPPWYRRTALYWVMSAKKEETRAKRLAQLISDSQEGRTIRALTRPTRSRS